MANRKRTIAAPVTKVEPSVQQPEESSLITGDADERVDHDDENAGPDEVEPSVQQPTVTKDPKAVVKPVTVQKATAANPILSELPKASKKTKVKVQMPDGNVVPMNRFFAEKAIKLNKGAKIIE